MKSGAHPASLLTPEVERKLAGLRFNIHYSMDGRLSGVHRSAQTGVSVEFSDHKEYSPGDDIRHLDWKAYARFDRFYVRQFTKDTHANVHLLLDTSGSMDYASPYGGLTKLAYSARLSAMLAYMFLRQNDAVGLLTIRGGKLVKLLPARSHPSHLITIQQYLEEILDAPPEKDGSEGPTSMTEGLEYLVSTRAMRHAVIVVSDFFLDMDSLFPYLGYLKSNGNFCWLIQVLDPAEFDQREGNERTFPFDGSMLLRSNETGHGILMDSKLARADYISRFKDFLKEMEDRSAERGIELSRCNTDADPVEFIVRYLQESRGRGA